MKTTAQVLREHALYHSTGEYWDIPKTTLGNVAFDELMDLNPPFDSAAVPSTIRRMFLLFIAESLENPC